MRAWWLGVGLSLVVAAPVNAATRVTIQDLKDFPERYYGQAIQLECHYDKESPIWVRALPDAEEWIGFFVVGDPQKSLSWSGEYYNLIFAPYAMRDVVRSLRGGDKITLIGEAFHYQSSSFEGAGIRVQQLFSGWGSSAKRLGESASSPLMPTASAAPVPAPSASGEPAPGAVAAVERYAVTLNGRRYEGLRVGDRYNFDGIDFQVERDQ